MSSHHIIREDQEPALVIMNTDAVPHERILELLEWSPTIMVIESCLAAVLEWGIKVDVVIAPESKTGDLTATLLYQFPVRILSVQHEHEALSTALYFLIDANQKAVNILSLEPLEKFEPFTALDLSVFRYGKRWSFIRHGVYEKWLPAGRTIHVYLSDKNSSRKTLDDGIITIKRDAGFWVAEE
ncbi:MAG: hypothetical protein WAZ98_08245 [Cyclobacteriaceae bacterium]